MSDSVHTKFLRSMPKTFNLRQPIIDSIYEAADYIEELEGQIRLLNRIGNIDASPGLVERVTNLEAKIQNMATKMDLEALDMQIGQKLSGMVLRR